MDMAFRISVGGQTDVIGSVQQQLMMMDKDADYRQGWLHALTDIQAVPLYFHRSLPFFSSHQCDKAAR